MFISHAATCMHTCEDEGNSGSYKWSDGTHSYSAVCQDPDNFAQSLDSCYKLYKLGITIPVSRLSNCIGGWADLISTKDSRPSSPCSQSTDIVLLDLIDTCGNLNEYHI